jgi:hypothetical protein
MTLNFILYLHSYLKLAFTRGFARKFQNVLLCFCFLFIMFLLSCIVINAAISILSLSFYEE